MYRKVEAQSVVVHAHFSTLERAVVVFQTFLTWGHLQYRSIF